MPKFKIQKKELFMECFLTPLSKYSRSARFSVRGSSIHCTSVDNESATVLFADYPTENQQFAIEPSIFSLRRLDKFKMFLDTIEDDNPEFEITETHIVYKKGKTFLKMALLSESVLPSPSISEKLLDALVFDHQFVLKPEFINKIVENSSIHESNKKIYFRGEEGSVIATFTDRANAEDEELAFEVAESDTDFPEFGIVYETLSKRVDFRKRALNISYRAEDDIITVSVNSTASTLRYIMAATRN